jgi:short subunit dehydrogenase-like uncharacterized protein
MTISRDNRPFDLVLFGASGYTGQLVAEYLAAHRPLGTRWAIAGRSPAKLGDVRQKLAAIDASLAELPILQADSDDEASLAALTGKTRVVCSTVGPYARYGKKLVAACAEQGTDYCDLCGEPQFIREAIDRYGARAKETGARIVPGCGFDSLPSDLGVFLLHEHFRGQGSRLASATFYLRAMKGGFSGGTIASMLNMMAEVRRDPAVFSLFTDPYALNPDRERDRGPDGPDLSRPRFDEDEQTWLAPFVMAAINTRVVRRSNALLGFAYGKDFRYAEVMTTGKGPAGWAKAAAISSALATVQGLGALAPTRRVLESLLPSAGEGPSKSSREGGFFKIRIVGRSADGARAVARVEGDRDPGYGETAKMLGESALCLAFDDLPKEGGLLTSAVAMGSVLIERLRRAGMVWAVA